MKTPHEFNARLAEVLDLARDVIDRPYLVQHLAEVAELSEALAADRALPFEGGNPIGAEASMLLDVVALIAECRAFKKELRARHWCMVAGVMIEMVKINMVDVLLLEARRPSTSDHDFAQPRR